MTDEKPKIRLASKKTSDEKIPKRHPHPVHPAFHELAKLLARQAVREYLEEEEKRAKTAQKQNDIKETKP